MTLDHKSRWAIPSLLAIAVVLSCGEPAGRSAAFTRATAGVASPPKGGGEPAGLLPSLVVSGEVAAFNAAPAQAGAAKRRDASGSLPSTVAPGSSAAYVPPAGARPLGAGGAAAQRRTTPVPAPTP